MCRGLVICAKASHRAVKIITLVWWHVRVLAHRTQTPRGQELVWCTRPVAACRTVPKSKGLLSCGHCRIAQGSQLAIIDGHLCGSAGHAAVHTPPRTRAQRLRTEAGTVSGIEKKSQCCTHGYTLCVVAALHEQQACALVCNGKLGGTVRQDVRARAPQSCAGIPVESNHNKPLMTSFTHIVPQRVRANGLQRGVRHNDTNLAERRSSAYRAQIASKTLKQYQNKHRQYVGVKIRYMPAWRQRREWPR